MPDLTIIEGLDQAGLLDLAIAVAGRLNLVSLLDLREVVGDLIAKRLAERLGDTEVPQDDDMVAKSQGSGERMKNAA